MCYFGYVQIYRHVNDMTKHLDPSFAHQAVLVYDCVNGNPNGDPDRGNLPRQDDETGHGIVTSVSKKRKIRNYVEFVTKDRPDSDRYQILIKEGGVINQDIDKSVEACNLKPDEKTKKLKNGDAAIVMKYVQEHYWDVRTFGAVLSTGVNIGTHCGPVQIGMGQSCFPVQPTEMTITRCASTNEQEGKDNKTMGRKQFIPYGLYRQHIYYNPCKDKLGVVTSDDLALLWESLLNIFEFSRSEARPEMAVRALVIFSHTSKYGNAPAHKLLESIVVQKLVDNPSPASFSDINLSIDYDRLADFQASGGTVTVLGL